MQMGRQGVYIRSFGAFQILGKPSNVDETGGGTNLRR